MLALNCQLFDVSILNKSINEFGELINDLERKYHCEWNDHIHDTFSEYNQNTKSLYDSSSELCRMCCSINDTSFNNDDLKSEADNIIREVDSL